MPVIYTNPSPLMMGARVERLFTDVGLSSRVLSALLLILDRQKAMIRERRSVRHHGSVRRVQWSARPLPPNTPNPPQRRASISLHPEKEKADVVAKKKVMRPGYLSRGVEVRGGGVVVNKRVLGRALGQLGAEFFGVRVCIKAMSSMLGM